MKKRVFLIVLDSCGAGEMPDCANFGDRDCHTIKRISTSDKFSCENLWKMGIGNIDGLDFLGTNNNPTGRVARLTERSMGKDTTIGHWEIAGIVSENPLPTYPNGFPQSVLDEFTARTGRKVICNKPYSGTDVIRDFGNEHLATGDLIVYTSADSVFQIAAHEDIVPIEQLYEYCRIAREILCGEHSVGRVIARPFEGEHPFKRTANRHDFSLEPYGQTVLDALVEQEKTVYAIGKIYDIFAGKGVSYKTFTHSNKEGMDFSLDALDHDFEGLCFINLVDFDMLYGHRQDARGYAEALSRFDLWLGGFMKNLKEGDLLMITADHGCDPSDESTDHTREYVPLLSYKVNEPGKNLGTQDGFATVANAVLAHLSIN